MKSYQFVFFLFFFATSKMVVASDSCESIKLSTLNKAEVETIQTLAKAGDFNAQATLGEMHLLGHGVNFDVKKALIFLSKSAAGGNSKGQYILGKYYLINGKHDDEFVEASKMLQQSAEQGCINALFYFGLLVEKGKVKDRKKSDGLAMILKAANSGYAKAQWWYGTLLVTGEGGHKDEKLGFEWIEKAANSGDSEAKMALANLYLLGVGIQKNPIKTQYLLESVFAKKNENSSAAAYSLGWMYMEGKGVSVNMIKAFRWMLIAANSNYSDAEKRFKIITKKLTKEKLISVCDVLFEPLFYKNNTKRYTQINKGENVIVLMMKPNSVEVYFPDKRLLGFISRQCLMER